MRVAGLVNASSSLSGGACKCKLFPERIWVQNFPCTSGARRRQGFLMHKSLDRICLSLEHLFGCKRISDLPELMFSSERQGILDLDPIRLLPSLL